MMAIHESRKAPAGNGADGYTPNLAPDDITTHACGLVALRGYLGKPRAGTSTSLPLYSDATRRHWTEIPAKAIRDRTSAEKELTKGPSTIWVDREATLVECSEVPAKNYDPPQRVAQPGEEDLGYRYPR